MLRGNDMSDMERIEDPTLKMHFTGFIEESALKHSSANKKDLTGVNFEKFVGFCVAKKYIGYANIQTSDYHTGGGNDGGCDGLLLIANGELISDVGMARELVADEDVKNLDIQCIFIQAKLTNKSKSPAEAIKDIILFSERFLSNNFLSNVNKKIKDSQEIYSILKSVSYPKISVVVVFSSSEKSSKSKNVVKSNIEEIKQAEKLLKESVTVQKFNIDYIGCEELNYIYNNYIEGVEATFNPKGISQIDYSNGEYGINSVYSGYISLIEYMKVISDLKDPESLEPISIRHGIFYENVRGFLGSARGINKSILKSLDTESGRALFFACTNGVTIVAKKCSDISSNSNQATIGQYQIVNGCQTSHILCEYYQKLIVEALELTEEKHKEQKENQTALKHAEANMDFNTFSNLSKEKEEINKKYREKFESITNIPKVIRVPIRIIVTQNDEVIDEIVSSTNNQNPVGALDLESRNHFHRQLESHFVNNYNLGKLYYERRRNQCVEMTNANKKNIISVDIMLKSAASLYLHMPAAAARNKSKLLPAFQDNPRHLFNDSHNYTAYYMAAYLYSKINSYFFDHIPQHPYDKFKFHILPVFKILYERITGKNSPTSLEENDWNEYFNDFYSYIENKENFNRIIEDSIKIISHSIILYREANSSFKEDDYTKNKGFASEIIKNAKTKSLQNIESFKIDMSVDSSYKNNLRKHLPPEEIMQMVSSYVSLEPQSSEKDYVLYALGNGSHEPLKGEENRVGAMSYAPSPRKGIKAPKLVFKFEIIGKVRMEFSEYLQKIYYEFLEKSKDNPNISLNLNNDVLKPENKKGILGEIEVKIGDDLYYEKMCIVKSLANEIFLMRRKVLG